jgi:uncharacterized protein YndB with AHSA1/START domain
VETPHTLRITRTYAAPPEKVNAAWTGPRALKRWFVPAGEFQTSEVEADVRVGGRYRIVMRAADGEVHRVGGVYREVVQARKLVFTWAWESTSERESLVAVACIAFRDNTELVLLHERFAEAGARTRLAGMPRVFAESVGCMMLPSARCRTRWSRAFAAAGPGQRRTGVSKGERS